MTSRLQVGRLDPKSRVLAEDCLLKVLELTRRQLEVLALVESGLSNAEIARRLFISEKTAGHHVSAILQKLDAGSRGEAAAAARKLGIFASQT